jgi:hypothetical protein
MPESIEPELPQPKSGSTTIVGVAVNVPGQSSENPDSEALKRLFQIALDTRNFEISQLVQRNNFFMIFQGVLLAGIVQSSHAKPVVSFLACLAGLAVSFYQVKMAAGAKFWQEYWEAALQKIEEDLVGHLKHQSDGRRLLFYLFHENTEIYNQMVRNRISGKGLGLTNSLIMNRYSVSRVPIYVAIALVAVWSLLTLCTLRGYPPLSVPSFVVGF